MSARLWELATVAFASLLALALLIGGSIPSGVAIGAGGVLWFASRVRITDGPGWLRFRREREGIRLAALGLLLITVLALLLVAPFLHWSHDPEGQLLLFALVGLAIALKRELERTDDTFHRLWNGLDAEEAVALELEVLRNDGWHVENNLPRNDRRGNVDHAVRFGERAFAIETKSHGFRNADLGQPIGNAVWLRHHWGARWVEPVLCVQDPSQATIERQLNGKRVWVVDRGGLVDLLRAIADGRHDRPKRT